MRSEATTKGKWSGTGICTPTGSCEIVAEIGASHRQDFDLAVSLIHHAENCGADAVKFSMFTADDMTLDRDDDEQFTIKSGPWKGSLHSLYEKTAIPYDWIPKLKDVAESDDLKFIVGVYHPRTVQIALDMGIEHFKVASFEVGYLDLLRALRDEQVYVSLGSANLIDIATVVMMRKVTLLKCTSDYPTNFEDLNLRAIPDLAQRFKRPVGLSDHSPGILAPVMAVALGATVIEKHLQIDGGMDEAFALRPSEFFTMVTTVRHAEKALGKVEYGGQAKSFHRKQVDGRMVRVVRED